MDLFEYQGKSLYQDYDISHPKSSLVKDPKELQELKGLSYPVVVKAQVQVGGRGRGSPNSMNYCNVISYTTHRIPIYLNLLALVSAGNLHFTT